MEPLPLIPLHPMFGVEVHDVDLRDVTPQHAYPAIREAFETHSLLLFRGQQLDDAAHLRLGALFGPIEDRSMGKNGPLPRMDHVSNLRVDNTVALADDLLTLNLMGNQLWHTDSTFLPVPALANILAARVLSSSGGETEFVSTRAAWRDLPVHLKARLRNAVFTHALSHSRSKVSPDLAKMERITRWKPQSWRAVWPNPRNGLEALYIASHAYQVDDLPLDASQALVDEVTAFATRPDAVYSHGWQPGDVLVWDERATLHRGKPWPYHEERTLASICISARDVDGLEQVRPEALNN
jgi:alpha-ketoglutarate-dependent 2,4-dichlorophenoxyacetate dioxygenase